MVEARGKILTIRGGAIGDFVLTLPVLAALRAHLPQAHLTVLGYPHIATLALAGGLADEVHPIEARGLASFFNPRAELPRQLADFFAGFSVIVSYLYDPDAVFQQSVRRCSSAVFIQGPHRPSEAEPRHATEVFLRPLEQLAIFDADPHPRLRLSSVPSQPPVGRDSVESAREPLPGRAALRAASEPAPTPRRPTNRDPRSQTPDPRPSRSLTLAVHPGSGSERKNWPEPRWAALLERLAAHPDLRLLLAGGEAEGDRLDRLARLWPADRLEVARSLPLVQLAERLATCHAFAGHDSGVTHLAGALGLPGLVLWGETNEVVWRPRSDRMHLLRGPEGLGSLDVARVEAALCRTLQGCDAGPGDPARGGL